MSHAAARLLVIATCVSVLVVALPVAIANVGWVLVMRGLTPRGDLSPPGATAERAFELSAMLRPGWSRPLVGLSFTRAEDRGALLERALQDDPRFQAGWLLLSRATEARGDTARADELLFATRSGPLLAREGDRVLHSGQTARAAALYQASIDADPASWYANVQLSVVELRDPTLRPRAERRLDLLLDSRPTLIPALVLRARAAIEDREWAAADAYLTRVQAVEPDNGDAHLLRARVARDGLADPDLALAELARAKLVLPQDGWVDVTIAETYLVAGRRQAGLDVLTITCARGDDSGAHACYLLADQYWRAGDGAKAEPLARRATELSSNPAYAALLRRVQGAN